MPISFSNRCPSFVRVISLFVLGFLFSLPACRNKPSARLQGYIEGEYVYVAAPVSGRLESLSVTRGDTVQTGQALFALEETPLKAARDEAAARLHEATWLLEDVKKGARPTEVASLTARLHEARAAAELSKKELDRLEYLFRTKATPQIDLDRGRSDFEQKRNQVIALESELTTAGLGARSDQITAQQAAVSALSAGLSKADWDLSQAKQAAVSTGLITDTLYRVGEWVSAGRPVVVQLPPKNIKARTFIPEQLLGSIHIGDTAEITIDGVDQSFKGVVRFIAPNAEFTPPVIYSREMREKLVYLLELGLETDNPNILHPGQPIEVLFGG